MDDLGTPLPAGKTPLIDQLVTTGIGGLYDVASWKNAFRPRRSAYLNHCDLCTEIRHHLVGLEHPGPALLL